MAMGSLLVGALGPASPPAGAAITPIATPGLTSQIVLMGTHEEAGWSYAYYENRSYPCALSGYYTFTIASPIDTEPEDVRPLWVYMHGGGYGYIEPGGIPNPNDSQMRQESFVDQRSYLEGGDTGQGGILRKVERSGQYRRLAVSMCGHDGYAGGGQLDPNNGGRTVHGLHATTAAVAYALRTVATDDYIIHGSSAGSFGAWGVAWSLEEQGLRATAIVADSGMITVPNPRVVPVGSSTHCPQDGPGRQAFAARLHPDIFDPDNAPAELVADGRLTSPVLDVWTTNDSVGCGSVEVYCTVNGVTTVKGGEACLHEPMRQAIAAGQAGPGSRSMALCVDDLHPTTPGPCDRHIPTTSSESYRNTDLTQAPADFQVEIMNWVTARRNATEPLPTSPRTALQSFLAAATTDLIGTIHRPSYEAAAYARIAGLHKKHLAQRLAISPDGLEYTVVSAYEEIAGWSEPVSTTYWVGELDSGVRTVVHMEATLYGTPDFEPSSNHTVWAAAMYQAVLNRPGTSGEHAYWASQAVALGSRSTAARRLLQTDEAIDRRIDGVYQDHLGRLAGPAEELQWRQTVKDHGDRALITEVVASTEYQNRSVTRFP